MDCRLLEEEEDEEDEEEVGGSLAERDVDGRPDDLPVPLWVTEAASTSALSVSVANFRLPP